MPSLKFKFKTAALVALYLAAVVAANLAVALYGPAALRVTAFLLIPFDLCARDVLHEEWSGRGLAFKMAALVAAGSALSYLISPASGRVALASMAAFAAAGVADALAYHRLRSWPRSSRMNLSNVCGAVVDSVAFPLLAFGATTYWLSSGQAGIKVAGGYLWTMLFVWLLRVHRRRRERVIENRLEDSLVEAGLLKKRREPITDLTPYRGRTAITVRGKPVSETIIDDRR